jgi:NAD-dependent dihydropyrimidine dehydrogenase PreA subunit
MVEVIIDEDKCVKCRECVVVCPTEVIVEEDNKPVVKDANRCIGCLSCSYICRSDAITHKDIYLEKKLVYDPVIEEKILKFI